MLLHRAMSSVRTPSQRIAAGFAMIHDGIADLRAERERIAREQDARTAALVDAEGQLKVLAIRSARARRARHLQASERCGPRALPRDGASMPAELDDRTLTSLRVYGLHSTPSEPRGTLDDKATWRRIFGV